MKVIEYAYPIPFKNVDEIISEAKSDFENSDRNKDYYYAYLSGVLKAHYSSLCIAVEIIHNNAIVDAKVNSNY